MQEQECHTGCAALSVPQGDGMGACSSDAYGHGGSNCSCIAIQRHSKGHAPKSAQLALKNALELHKKALASLQSTIDASVVSSQGKDRHSEAKTLNLASSALVMSE
eukprot:5025847-Amphidinium_carterae.1